MAIGNGMPLEKRVVTNEFISSPSMKFHALGTKIFPDTHGTISSNCSITDDLGHCADKHWSAIAPFAPCFFT